MLGEVVKFRDFLELDEDKKLTLEYQGKFNVSLSLSIYFNIY